MERSARGAFAFTIHRQLHARMSRILLVIGLASTKSAATPELVYLGRSGDAMRAAIAAAPHPRLIIVPHVQGIPKNNPRAAANAAAEHAVDEQLTVLATENEAAFERVVAERDKLERAVVALQDDLAASRTQISTLEQLLSGKPPVAEPPVAPAEEAPAQEAPAEVSSPRRRR